MRTLIEIMRPKFACSMVFLLCERTHAHTTIFSSVLYVYYCVLFVWSVIKIFFLLHIHMYLDIFAVFSKLFNEHIQQNMKNLFIENMLGKIEGENLLKIANT